MSFQDDKQNTNLIQESDLKMSFVTQTSYFILHVQMKWFYYFKIVIVLKRQETKKI